MKRQFVFLLLSLLCYSLGTTLRAQTNIGRYTPPSSWTSYEVGDGMLEVSIPSTMEYRDYNSVYGQKLKAHPINNKVIVFQQKGLNDMTASGIRRYARVMINYTYGSPGDFLSRTETEPLGVDWRNMIETLIHNELGGVGKLLTKLKIRWVSISGIKAIETQYRRTGTENSTVSVCHYMLFDNDRMATIIVSVRDRDKKYFEPDLSNVIRTFKWK